MTGRRRQTSRLSQSGSDSPLSLSAAVLGAGSIGISWCLVLARAGHAVYLYDADRGRRSVAQDEIRAKLAPLQAGGLLDEDAATIASRVVVVDSLRDAVRDVAYLQECVPESLELKREVLDIVGEHAPADCVVASSSSALMPSVIFDRLPEPERALVVHPVNPAHLLPVVELVPGPFTAPSVVRRVYEMLQAAGMSPVRIEREIEGFVLNRLQGAVLREAYALVRDGVTDVEGVDRIVRDGLAPRWCVVGPFETTDLNTRGGLEVHAERMGPAYARMGAERGQDDPWTPELVASVVAQRRALLPIDLWEERVAWRDSQLIAQLRARRRKSP